MLRRRLSLILILYCFMIFITSCSFIENSISGLIPGTRLEGGGQDTPDSVDDGQSPDIEEDVDANGSQQVQTQGLQGGDSAEDPEYEGSVKGSEPEAPAEEPEEDVTVTISFAGDCTIGTDETFTYTNSFPHRFQKVDEDFSYFFAGVKDIFENDDLTLVNLETTFTTSNKKAKKRFRFKGDPSYVEILKEGSIEMVNISNNHIYDYLQKGFDDTLETLEQAGILYSGEGHVAFYETKGITIASLGYQGWNTDIKKEVKGDIEEVRDKADLVVVSFHWGKESTNYPNGVQRELGRFAIDQGADIVAGHHAHVIQGIEEYNGKFILYGLGNFCFGGNRNPRDKDTFIFQSEFVFRDGELKENLGKVIPCQVSSVKDVNDYQPTVLDGEEAKRVMKRLKEYSSGLEYGMNFD
ncbi:MAG: CapA family protein [Clostridiales bacterium]|nr:CapA family protein [Clostridiales bacterium]